MGSHRDWVAVGSALGGIVSLSADGGLWYWWDRSNNFDPHDSAQPMLATPRRPVKIENIFDASGG